jgi:hypothetical protein
MIHEPSWFEPPYRPKAEERQMSKEEGQKDPKESPKEDTTARQEPKSVENAKHPEKNITPEEAEKIMLDLEERKNRKLEQCQASQRAYDGLMRQVESSYSSSAASGDGTIYQRLVEQGRREKIYLDGSWSEFRAISRDYQEAVQRYGDLSEAARSRR